MKTPAVISVNPATKTLGAISEEAKMYDRPIAGIVSRITVTPRLKESLNILTGISTPAMTGASARIMTIRIVIGAALIISYAVVLSSGNPTTILIPALVLGISLLSGFLTRIVSVATMVCMILFVINGNAELPTALLTGFAAFIFAVIGPGIYSIDQFLRKSIFRRYMRNRRHHKQLRTNMNYKAYTRI